MLLTQSSVMVLLPLPGKVSNHVCHLALPPVLAALTASISAMSLVVQGLPCSSPSNRNIKQT